MFIDPGRDPCERRHAVGGRAGDAERVSALPAADAAAEVRRAPRRATGRHAL